MQVLMKTNDDIMYIYIVKDKDGGFMSLFLREDLARDYCEIYPCTYKKYECFFDAIDIFEVKE